MLDGCFGSGVRIRRNEKLPFGLNWPPMAGVDPSPAKEVNFVLNVLFNFSVLGNQPSQMNQTVYRYQNKEAQFNFREKVVVHTRLHEALQII